MSANTKHSVSGSAKHVVVLGAGYAGMVTALRCSGQPSDQIRVTVVNPVDQFVERVRLHEAATGRPLRKFTISKWLRGRPADLVVGRATAIDPDGQKVMVRTDVGTSQIPYDVLVYATGSLVDLSSVPGASDYAHSLADMDAADRLLGALREAPQGATVAVCGGGASGIEAASEIAERFPDVSVTLLTRGAVGGWLSERGCRHVHIALARLGVDVVEGVTVAAIDGGHVELDDGRRFVCDLSVWAGPFAVGSLAAEAGLACAPGGRVVVDASLRSVSHPTVIAAGDAALALCEDGTPTRLACATAMPMGAQAANSALAAARGTQAPLFLNRYAEQCLSVGRHDGVVQRLDQHDRPAGWVLTGRSAAWMKAAVVRGTIWGIQLFRRAPTAAIPGLVPSARQARRAVPGENGRHDDGLELAAVAEPEAS